MDTHLPKSSPIRLAPVTLEFWLPRSPASVQWTVASMQGRESISSPYQFDIELVTDDTDLIFQELAGSDCELTMDRDGLPRRIQGIIERVEAAGSASEPGTGPRVLRVRVVPAFKLLEQHVDTRFFEGMSVPEILGKLLADELGVYHRKLDSTGIRTDDYRIRDYCVQFRESTFAFCSRLMEEEGIAYIFVPDPVEQREVLRLVDANAQYEDVELIVPGPLPVVTKRPETLDRESVFEFQWRETRRPNRVVVQGYNYKQPDGVDEGVAERADAHHPSVRAVCSFGEIRQFVDDADEFPILQDSTGPELDQRGPEARRGLERYVLESSLGRGQSNAVGLLAGGIIELLVPDDLALDESELLVVAVTHAVEGVGTYANEFECTPRHNEYRPPLRTPRPRVHGVQTGVVIGPDRADSDDTDEKYGDCLGRIRVAFHEGHPCVEGRHRVESTAAACWIRVAQAYAGHGYGAWVIPRIGMEVVVSFIDGNPDSPVITGCVYNGQNRRWDFPWDALPAISSFRARSTGDGDRVSELSIVEEEGFEQVFVHAERRLDIRVRGQLYQTNTGNREECIGNPESGDHNVKVLRDVNHHVARDHYVQVDGARYETLVGPVIQDYQSDHTIMVAGARRLNAARVVEEVSESISQRAAQFFLTSSSTFDVKTGGRIALDSNNGIEIRVGSSFISITPTEIAISAPRILLNSGGSVGAAAEGLRIDEVEVLEPLEALAAATTVLPGVYGGGGGGGSKRGRGSHIVRPQPAPPLDPPPPDPADSDGESEILALEWETNEAWCSEVVMLSGRARGDHGKAVGVELQDASDGKSLRNYMVTTQALFRQAIEVVDVLPRRLGGNFELVRRLDAVAAGVRTPKPIELRFISNLVPQRYDEGYGRFELTMSANEIRVGGVIPYVKGWLHYIIDLGDTVPATTGGLIGEDAHGRSNWRYCRQSEYGTSKLFWTGEAWEAVPPDWTSDVENLHGNAVWQEDGLTKVQTGTLPWPDPVEPWGPAQQKMADRTLEKWTEGIYRRWTNKFDIVRKECRSTAPRCCRYKLRFEVTFEERAAHGRGIVLCGNGGRSNAGAWSIAYADGQLAPHEFGHHLGNPDEYEGSSSVDPSIDGDGAVDGIDESSIMGEGFIVKRRHFGTICRHLATMVRDQYGRDYSYEAVPFL